MDFLEDFSMVVKPVTLRIVLSLSLTHHWLIQQLNIKNVFIHGVLSKEVYIEQPQGLCDSSSFTHVRPFVASNRLRKPSVRDSVPFSFIMTLYVAGLALACFSFDPWPS